MTSPQAVYDFSLPADTCTVHELKTRLGAIAKKWAFQVEKGDKTGYLHYQGRCSLKVKARPPQCKSQMGFESVHLSITSNANKTNEFYVLKEDTRVNGPYTDRDPYVPRHIRDITLKAWQQTIVDSAKIFDDRRINILIDEFGNIGKSVVRTYIGVHKIGRPIPPFNDYKDINRCVMDCVKMPLYIIDIPKAIKKSYLSQLYAGIESVKDGYVFDDRYNFRDEYFDPPQIWVFTNTRPDESWLTQDRWKFWVVGNSDQLIEHI